MFILSTEIVSLGVEVNGDGVEVPVSIIKVQNLVSIGYIEEGTCLKLVEYSGKAFRIYSLELCLINYTVNVFLDYGTLISDYAERYTRGILILIQYIYLCIILNASF